MWKFDLGYERVPENQALVLEELGVLGQEEKAKALGLAREDWQESAQWLKERGVNPGLMPSDVDLLTDWPHPGFKLFLRCDGDKIGNPKR